MVSTTYCLGAGGATTGGGGGGATARAARFCGGAAGAGAPPGPVISASSLIPAVRVGSTSSGLRRAREIRPLDDASAMRSASSGVTASVTTVVGCASPLRPCSWSIRVPDVSTSTFPSTVLDIGLSCEAEVAMVTTTSTRVPGTTNPATPTTSSTRTDMARIPGGMVGGRPAPDDRGASLLSVMGSFSTTPATRPRRTTSSNLVNEPGTGLLVGQATSLRSLSWICVPVGSVPTATTIFVLATSTSRTGMRLTARYTP